VDALFLRHVGSGVGFRVGLDQQPVVARPHGAGLVRGDVGNPLPFRDASFDHVTLLAVIEHLREPDGVLREAHRILAPGGSLILTWPNARVDSILTVLRWIGLVSAEMRSDQHQPRRSPAEWAAKLSALGFHDIVHRRFEMGFNNVLVALKRRNPVGSGAPDAAA